MRLFTLLRYWQWTRDRIEKENGDHSSCLKYQQHNLIGNGCLSSRWAPSTISAPNVSAVIHIILWFFVTNVLIAIDATTFIFDLKLYSTSSILQFTKARPINKINSSIKHWWIDWCSNETWKIFYNVEMECQDKVSSLMTSL